MKNYKVLLCVGCLFFANQSFAKTILPSKKTKFVSLFNSKVGDYELVFAQLLIVIRLRIFYSKSLL